MDKRPSEIINDFLRFLERAEDEYRAAYADMGAEDNKLQTILHDIEFAPNKAERNKIATKLQQSRRTRREAKDRVTLYEKVHELYTDRQYANLLKALRRLQNDQVAKEKYLSGNREFKKRVEYE